eukprot:SAG22_NODE_10053_length_555_cov_2.239035_1_plen_36_part_10
MLFGKKHETGLLLRSHDVKAVKTIIRENIESRIADN